MKLLCITASKNFAVIHEFALTNPSFGRLHMQWGDLWERRGNGNKEERGTKRRAVTGIPACLARESSDEPLLFLDLFEQFSSDCRK